MTAVTPKESSEQNQTFACLKRVKYKMFQLVSFSPPSSGILFLDK